MIELTDKIGISSDEFNWIVEKKVKIGKVPKGVEPKNEYKTQYTYHSTLQSALKAVVDADLKSCESLEEISLRLDEWRSIFQKLFSFVFV